MMKCNQIMNLRRFEGKIANFENYSSFHEHGSAFWRLEFAAFRFGLIVGAILELAYYANFQSSHEYVI